MVSATIYTGNVFHQRFLPKAHQFRYPMLTLAVDLKELPNLSDTVRGFSYNKRGIWSFRDEHYFYGKKDVSLYESAMSFLADHVDVSGIDRITMLSMPRLLGIGFNPVSFFYYFDTSGTLQYILAEVNNTFGERHMYILKDPLDAPTHIARFKADKTFHVSPFFDEKGGYDFRFSPLQDNMSVAIDYLDGDTRLLHASLTCKGMSLNSRNLARTMVKYPLSIALTVPRIAFQGMLLWLMRRLTIQKKPIPLHPNTIGKAAPSFFQRLFISITFSLLRKFKVGAVSIHLPNNDEYHFGDDSDPIHIYVRDYRFFSRVLFGGDIGLGESYMTEEWESDHVVEFLGLMIRNREVFNTKRFRFLALFLKPINRLRQFFRRNTITNSRKNIQAHYDLSNDFYRLFLDDSMMYSAAVFKSDNDSLEIAQKQKLDQLIRLAEIGPKDHVLEIGCGWGGFAIEAVKQTGCKVTGITLSKAQFELATARVLEAGLQDHISIELIDYRHVKGRFDKIVSIEMLEAVGHEYLATYFKAVDHLLKPGGVAAIQVITVPDQHYDDYRKGTDFIRKHIFPGGHLPSLYEMLKVMRRHTDLMLSDMVSVGDDYATTLYHWRERFLDEYENVKAQGFSEEFIRKWLFYLMYCEAGFRYRSIDDIQMVLKRPFEGKNEVKNA